MCLEAESCKQLRYGKVVLRCRLQHRRRHEAAEGAGRQRRTAGGEASATAAYACWSYFSWPGGGPRSLIICLSMGMISLRGGSRGQGAGEAGKAW